MVVFVLFRIRSRSNFCQPQLCLAGPGKRVQHVGPTSSNIFSNVGPTCWIRLRQHWQLFQHANIRKNIFDCLVVCCCSICIKMFS